MRQLILRSTLFFLCSISVSADAEEPSKPAFEFKGITAAEPVDMSLLRSCEIKQDGQTKCYLKDGKVAGYSGTIPPAVYLYDGKLWKMFYIFKNSSPNYSNLLAALRTKYGPPCRIETRVWQNRLGAKLDNPVITWCFKTGELELIQFISDVTLGGLSYVDEVNAGPPKPPPTVDF